MGAQPAKSKVGFSLTNTVAEALVCRKVQSESEYVVVHGNNSRKQETCTKKVIFFNDKSVTSREVRLIFTLEHKFKSRSSLMDAVLKRPGSNLWTVTAQLYTDRCREHSVDLGLGLPLTLWCMSGQCNFIWFEKQHYASDYTQSELG